MNTSNEVPINANILDRLIGHLSPENSEKGRDDTASIAALFIDILQSPLRVVGRRKSDTPPI
jgi:hypothetical protein